MEAGDWPYKDPDWISRTEENNKYFFSSLEI